MSRQPICGPNIIIQSTIVISNSLISNNRLSRSENLVPVLTQRSTKGNKILCKRGEIAPYFPQYFQYISNLGVKLHIHSVKGGCSINCFPQFRKSDISKYWYLEVFHRAPWSSRKRESTVFVIRSCIRIKGKVSREKNLFKPPPSIPSPSTYPRFLLTVPRRFVRCSFSFFVRPWFMSIGITSLGEESANLSTFRTFVRFSLVWFYPFPLPLGVWEGLRLVFVALPGLFSYIFYVCAVIICSSSLLSLVPQEGCASYLKHFLGIFT